MSKLRSPRIATVQARHTGLRAPKIDNTDPETAERKAMYRHRRWSKVRNSVLESQPFCAVCADRAVAADHTFGHRDDAKAAGRLYGLSVPADWRRRFWVEAWLVSLCAACHNRKTAMETRGRLLEWHEQNAASVSRSITLASRR